MFLNITNHPSGKWSAEQTSAAKGYGEVSDLPFPNIPAGMTSREVKTLAAKFFFEEIWPEDYLPIGKGRVKGILLQGEFTFVVALLRLIQLWMKEVPVFAACSERQVVETVNEKGETVKNAVFSFIQFREYTR